MRDITGQEFGQLFALAPTEKRDRRSVVWKFLCACGHRTEKSLRAIGATQRAGRTAHCGCANRGLATPFSIDLSGGRYGRLTVLCYQDRGRQGHRWLCMCDCGGLSIVRGKDLRAGTTTSCGCGRSGRRRPQEEWKGRTIQDGEKFGRLTVRYFACIDRGSRHYWCDCECGGSTLVRSGLLTTGQTKSCGCLRGRPAAAKRAAARDRAIATAGKTASQLKVTPKIHREINSMRLNRRLMRTHSEPTT